MDMAKEWEISYFEWQRSPNQVFGYRLNLYAPGAVKCGILLISDSQATDWRLINDIEEILSMHKTFQYIHLHLHAPRSPAPQRAILSMDRGTQEMCFRKIN